MPELSVCIPTYNSAHFLPDAISSIMRQSLSDFEIVIVDNASQDDTEAVVRAANNPRIRYFRNTENFGPHYSFRRCLAEAEGTYVKYLCADDVLIGGVLPKQLKILKHSPKVGLVSCDMLVTDSKLRVERMHRFFPGTCSGAWLKNVCLSGLGNYIGGPSNFMFRRDGWETLPSDTSYHAVSDLKFALGLLERGSYANIDEPGHFYRRHSQSDSMVGVSEEQHKFEFMRLVDEYDWWNLVNCLMTIRRGGPQWENLITKKWLHSFFPNHLVCAIASSFDVLRLYVRDRRDYFEKVPPVFVTDDISHI